jgi:DNA-directed RNA polymerase subunit RPC12/RpoP
LPTYVIRNLEIEPLLTQLHQDYSNMYEKVWECGGMINGVFIQSELALRTISEQTITIILQYYTEKRECEVTVICSGGGEGFLRIDLGSQSAAEATFMKNLEMLARRHDWELSRKYPGRKGSGCPFCGAYYLYTEEKIQDDGSVVCQNCNRSFMLKNESKLKPHEDRLV